MGLQRASNRPKGVVLTHADCLWSGERVAAATTLGADARRLTSLPTFHVRAEYGQMIYEAALEMNAE